MLIKDYIVPADDVEAFVSALRFHCTSGEFGSFVPVSLVQLVGGDVVAVFGYRNVPKGSEQVLCAENVRCWSPGAWPVDRETDRALQVHESLAEAAAVSAL